METTQTQDAAETNSTTKELSTKPLNESPNRLVGWLVAGSIISLTSLGLGIGGGFLGAQLATNSTDVSRELDTIVSNPIDNSSVVDQSSAVVDVAEKTALSVVSIVISKDLPVYRDSTGSDSFGRSSQTPIGTQSRQIGAGTGFVISKDGLILTNRHVVADKSADYTVVLNDNTKFEAEVLARDILLDIAVIKVKLADGIELSPLNLGDSDKIKIGQTAVSIGNSLGRFSNTVSAGIISGLDRTITASSRDGLDAQLLEGVIQTDASINPGNSGGPLLDIAGNVIGVNVAIAEDANNVGFAIPINFVKPVIKSIIETGTIKRPYVGVRYVQVTPEIAESEKLPVDYGALLESGTRSEAVLPNSPAAKAGIKPGDLIVSINGLELKNTTSMQREIQKYFIGDKVTLGIYRDGKLIEIMVTLEELK